jgi:hypothetical protein
MKLIKLILYNNSTQGFSVFVEFTLIIRLLFRAMDVSANNLPPEDWVRECDTQLSTLLNDLGIGLVPDSTVQDEALVYLINTCPEQPLIRVADIQPEIEELPAATGAAPKQSSTKKRRRVVVNRKRHSKKFELSNSSSSSFSSSSSNSPPSKVMTSVRHVEFSCKLVACYSIDNLTAFLYFICDP